MLRPIISTINYEISLTEKLLNSEFPYYSIYMLTVLLKHLADYLTSKKLNKPVSTFNYLDLLTKEKIISNDDKDFLALCIKLTRNKNRLIKNYKDAKLEKITEILNKIKTSV